MHVHVCLCMNIAYMCVGDRRRESDMFICIYMYIMIISKSVLLVFFFDFLGTFFDTHI